MNYRVKNATGPWTAGQIITDKDVEGWMAGGGVKRLRDKLGAIENTTEKPGESAGDTASLVEHSDRAPENTTGNTKRGASTVADAPNVGGQRPAGKS